MVITSKQKITSKDGVTILVPSRAFYRVVYGLYISRLTQWEWEIKSSYMDLPQKLDNNQVIKICNSQRYDDYSIWLLHSIEHRQIYRLLSRNFGSLHYYFDKIVQYGH